MRQLFTAIGLFFCSLLAAQEGQDLALQTSVLFKGGSGSSSTVGVSLSAFDFSSLQAEKKPVRKVLGFSKSNQLIDYYYFPGQSNKNALVIGGVHGSELSAIEVAYNLVRQLQEGEKPYYNVVIIPRLFPDNANNAEDCPCDRHKTNTGRYTFDGAIDPNRQLPKLGQPFYPLQPLDAYGREVEPENALLLQLIQAFAPTRIVNLHAIKEYQKAGVYADPRTDCRRRALGYTSDSLLALKMAGFIAERGGNVPGNKLRTAPTALYHLDPKPTPAGTVQPRNLFGANTHGKIDGVSLGGWASTAVCDEATGYSRPAIRVLTMEFPGYLTPAEYTDPIEQEWFAYQVSLYAGAIYTFFLGEFVPEEDAPTQGALVLK